MKVVPKSGEVGLQGYEKTICDRIDVDENSLVALRQEKSPEIEYKTTRKTFSTSVQNEFRCSLDSHLIGMLKRSPMCRRRTVESIGIRVTPQKSITWAQKLESIRKFDVVVRPKRFRTIMKTLRIFSSCRARGD